jgi:hypothetical protein
MTSTTMRGSYDTTAYDSAGSTGFGWVMFAAILLFLAGIWNVFDGILAISSSHVFVSGAHYVFSGLSTWGWIVMLLGVLQIAAGSALLGGSDWAKWFGITVAAVNSIGQLMFLPAYPFWALSMFTVDMLIIYGLAMYGGSKLRTE